MNLQDIRCFLIDLDDTLYPQNNGIWDMIRERINLFLRDEMGFPADEVPTIRHRLWQQYGTTLRGLQEEFSVDMDAFLDYVHDVPLETVMAPDPELDHLLTDLPQRKIIFTNANAAHACRVIELLDVTKHFEAVVDIYAMSPHCKPEVEAFQKAFALINEAPEHCLLIDDAPANLKTAAGLGMATVSIGKHHHDGSPHIETILELRDLFHV